MPEIAGAGLRSVSAWLPAAHDLPHFRGFLPALGGSDERVGW